MDIVFIVVAAVVGIVIGAIVARVVSSASDKQSSNNIATLKKNAESEAKEIVENAMSKAENIASKARLEAQEEALKYREKVDEENRDRLNEIRSSESRINQREDSLNKRSENLDKREEQIDCLSAEVDKKNEKADSLLLDVQERLEKVSGMSKDQAKGALLDSVKEDVVAKEAAIIREAEARAKAEADKNARMILSVAIQRLASEHTQNSTVTSVTIPNDDIKGRIIGREGRNIRTFEQVTGTSLGIDDSPEVVSISCHDPVRRAIGVLTMENLVADGRIHPAKIEELFDKATRSINEKMNDAAESAAFETGIHDIHPELMATLGRLLYRTSFSQNVLNHSIEVAHLAAMMASELGLDPKPAKRAGLLHDIGKAIDHESEGSHALIGGELAKKYGEAPEIVHAISAHHGDIEPNTVLDVLIQAADAVSASRPGARKESLENYIKRLEQLEEIANSHEGVEKTFAMQAGREVRVMVDPGKIDDNHAVVLAHDIASEIEEQAQYPGQVKVIVIRESRATEIAK